jgi:hypothetical protein
MEKTQAIAFIYPQEPALRDEALSRDPGASEPRALADWELVMVGGGDMTPDW